MNTTCCIVNVLNADSHEGFFQVYFVEKTASRYSNRFAFRHGLTQEEILCWRLLDDPDTMMKYRDTVASSPGGQYRVLDQNPIHLGFFLSTIEQGGKIINMYMTGAYCKYTTCISRVVYTCVFVCEFVHL